MNEALEHYNEGMSEIVDWVQRLKELERKSSANVAANFRRILIPGWEPIELDGFLRTEAQGNVPVFGGTPTSFSVLEWLDNASGESVQMLSELPSQIGALLTLVSDRKVIVLDELSAKHENTNILTFMPMRQHADARLVSPLVLKEGETINQLFTDELSKLCSLPSKQQTALVEAINLHYGAVLLYELDLAAAYTLVVAGIETLSKAFSTPPTGWSKWDQSEKWDAFMKEIKLTEAQRTQVRERLLSERQILLKQTFVNYAVQELPDSMWDEEWREWMYTIDASAGTYSKDGSWTKDDKVRDHITDDREKLRTAIRKSYDARSGFVHQGKREINLLSHIQGTLVVDYTKPLPFSFLRTILSALIRQELNRQSKPFSLPEITIVSEE